MSTAYSAPTSLSGKKSLPPAATISDDARAAALQFLTALAKEVSSGTLDLPCFPNIVIRIRNVLADPNTTSEHVVIIVGAEPRLAARLVQTANSVAFNQSGKVLCDLQSAVTRLGHQLVQSAAMAYAVQHLKNEKSLRGISGLLSTLWQRSIMVASMCREVARHTKVNPEEAFLTGLLHGIGSLYILVRSAGKTSEIKDLRSFMELIAGWQASIGKAVLENWGFAEPICEAVGAQSDWDRDRRRGRDPDLGDVLVVSIVLSGARGTAEGGEVYTDDMPSFAILGLTQQDCAGITAQAKSQTESLHAVLGC